jgi:hypothetical protein
MVIKQKKLYLKLEKDVFFWTNPPSIETLVLSLYQCIETRSIEVSLTVVSATSAPPFEHHHHQRNICHQGGFSAPF